MITFKQYINEGILGNIAALGIAGAAMTAPPATQPPAQTTTQTTTQKAKPTYHAGTYDFIKNAEGFRDTSYADKGQFSVGYGTGMHTDGTKVKPGEKVTKQQAHEMMVNHIDTRIVPKASGIAVWEKMNDRQRGAFVSFLYNVGEGVIGNKEHPKFNAALASGDVDAVFDHMQTYNKTTEKDKKTGKKVKVVNPGLVKRRQAERDFAYAKD
jgi:GH24 family phage-related lysozyme (muramidase)